MSPHAPSVQAAGERSSARSCVLTARDPGSPVGAGRRRGRDSVETAQAVGWTGRRGHNGSPSMASRRWVITTPPPRTATCPRCPQSRNRLSVYPTFEGTACYSCLTTAVAPDRPTGVTTTSVIAEPIAVRSTASARSATCPQAGYGRLPAHRGGHRATLRRRPKAIAESVASAFGA